MARRTALPITVIDRAEASDDEPNITTQQAITIRHALVTAGVEFAPQGLRLRRDEKDGEP